MKGVNWKGSNLLLLPLMIYSSMVFAERSGFYTIVGPDGRIMVIDRNAAAVPAKPAKASSAGGPASARPDALPAQPERGEAPVQAVAPQVAQTPQPMTVSPVPVSQVQLPRENTVPSTAVRQPVTTAQPKQDRQGSASAVTNQAGKQQPPQIALPVQSDTLSADGQKMPASVTATNVPKTVQASSLAQPVDTVPKTDEGSNPVTVINGEQYIDSEYLEQREFNLDGKKRFYSLPDGMGRTQVLEREKGVDMSVFKGPKVEAPKVVTLSRDYERLDAEKVVSLTGVQCFSEKQLEKAKVIKEKATVDFWPRPSFEPRFDFVLARFDTEVSDIEFTSYAGSMNNPAFYWPLPIFLDKNACVLEGVNAFYQRNINATSLQHQGLQGFLHVPAGAKYILLTPLEAAADLSNIKLTNKGQIRLTPVR